MVSQTEQRSRLIQGVVEKTPGSARWTLDVPLILILLASAALRLLFLDYSHFQGDEIKALYPRGAAFPEFLFSQGKGPTQYLVTLLVRLITGGYKEWVTRLPFALSSLFAVYVLYRLVRDGFGRSTALLSAALFGTCGLVVAFGRVVQYQSFCMLFVLLTAYFLFGWLEKNTPLLLYLGFLFYALALLTHYDALTFAPTLGALVIAGCRRHMDRFHSTLKHLTLACVMCAVLVGLFYIPYGLQSNFKTAYLLRRVASGWGMRTFTTTYALLGLYLPPFYLGVTIPLLAYGVACVLRRRGHLPGLILLFWFFTVFSFYMLLGGDPRSHVYNYILPGLVLVALGLEGVGESARHRLAARFLRIGVWVLIVAFACATYYMVVDHTVEHPWYSKTILGYPLPNVEARRIDGVFGFPYQRGFLKVGALFQSGQLTGSFDSNERVEMANHYFRAGRASPPDYYIYVHRPVSPDWHLPAFVAQHYRWIGEISVEGRKTVDIYESPRRANASPLTPTLSPSWGRGGQLETPLPHQGRGFR